MTDSTPAQSRHTPFRTIGATILFPLLLATGCGDGSAILPDQGEQANGFGETTAEGRTFAQPDSTPVELALKHAARSLPHEAPEVSEKSDFDPSFESNQGISLKGGAAFDTTEAYSGSRSIFLNSPGDAFDAGMVPVKADHWYTISGFMKLDSVPKPITNILIQVYDSNGRWAYNAADYTFSVSANRAWEEFAVPVYVKPAADREVGALKINIRYKENPASSEFVDASIWIDQLRITEARDSASTFGFEPPEPRTPFSGKHTRIDALGNWEVRENGEWKPLFPLIVYPDFQDDDWSKYREHGFNAVSQITYPGGARRAINAGLYWMWDITSYLYSADAFPGSNPSTGDTEKLQREFDAFERETGFNGMLSFYWDNEDLNEWDSVKKITDRLKQLDASGTAENGRRFPIYMNSKHTLANPLFMNDDYQFIDVQGCYINPMTNPHTGEYQPEWAMFVANDKMARLKSPTGIGIINVPHEGDHIEPLIFAGIARGMRGFAFWRDGFQGKYRIESRAWWPTFRRTADRIEQMLPLIRQPHWTDWPLDASIPEREDTLVIGKRDFAGKRHVILASMADKAQTVTLSTDRQIATVRDYFSGEVLSAPNASSFDFTLAAHATAVLVLE